MVNVTQTNFIEQSNDLLKHLPDATFVAIDEEMTGIRGGRLSKDDTPEQRYDAIREVPQRYSVIQVGVCLFTRNPDYLESNNQANYQAEAEYVVRRYNFFLFPPTSDDITREVTLNPSSIAFLNEHGMDFNLWTKQGINYVTGDIAETLLEQYKTTTLKANNDNSSSNPIKDPSRRRIKLTKQEDVQFHARAMASLREWIDASIRGAPSLLLPACNRFMRRALYESIELEYPALILENGGPDHNDQIRVWRLSEEEKKQRKERLQREAWEKLILNIGFWRVFRALSNANKGFKEVNSIVMAENVDEVDVTAMPLLEPLERRVPIIVHHGLMDILFLLTHFHSHQLPESYEEAKALIANTFPLIYDTKILATECMEQTIVGDNTVLGTLYTKFVENNDEFHLERNFDIVNVTMDSNQLHEASYDAFMTGAVFVALTSRIIGDDIIAESLYDMLSSQYDHVTQELFGRNKLYLMLTLYTIDLENPTSDPLRKGLSPTSTYRVYGIDPAISTSDIIRCLSNLVDEVERQVQFEIVWVSDRCFLVAARAHEDNATLQHHGQLIYMALRRRFAVEDICTLEQYMEKVRMEKEAKGSRRGIWSSIMGLFGYGNKRKSEEWNGDGSERAAKRRRAS